MPRAGDAFLNGALPVTHDPLARIDTQKNKPVFDLEAILQQVEQFVTDFLFPAIKELTGIDLSFLGDIFQGIDLTNPGGILAAITTNIGTIGLSLIQQVMDALAAAFGGGTSGNDPLSLLLAVGGQLAQIPVQILQVFEQFNAQFAQLFAGQQALQNSPGTVLLDDFATAGVSGYTNIVGTLAVSSLGPYIQTPAFSMAYRTASPASDQQAGQIVIDANQQGWAGVGICSDTSASSYALLQVYSGFEGDAVRLLTGSSPTVAVPQMQADFLAPRLANTNTFDVWYESVTNTFHVLRNNEKVFDWPDTTNILTHGASYQKGLLLSNGEDNPELGRRGPGLRKAQFYVKS